MAAAPITTAPMARAGGGRPAGPRPQQAAAVGPCSASRWSALTPQRRLVILLRREGGDEAAPKIQAAWRAHRMRQRHADELQWQVVDPCAVGLEPEPLRHTCEQALREAVIRPGGGGEAADEQEGGLDDHDDDGVVVGDPIAVEIGVGVGVDVDTEQRLVSFVYCSQSASSAIMAVDEDVEGA